MQRQAVYFVFCVSMPHTSAGTSTSSSDGVLAIDRRRTKWTFWNDSFTLQRLPFYNQPPVRRRGPKIRHSRRLWLQLHQLVQLTHASVFSPLASSSCQHVLLQSVQYEWHMQRMWLCASERAHIWLAIFCFILILRKFKLTNEHVTQSLAILHVYKWRSDGEKVFSWNLEHTGRDNKVRNAVILCHSYWSKLNNKLCQFLLVRSL